MVERHERTLSHRETIQLFSSNHQPQTQPCHCFGVLGEAVFFERFPAHRHCFSEDSEAVAHPRLLRSLKQGHPAPEVSSRAGASEVINEGQHYAIHPVPSLLFAWI